MTTQDLHRAAVLHRRKGDSLERSGRHDAADEAYGMALGLLDDVLAGFPEALPQDTHRADELAAEAAELWGERGGILRRRGSLDAALASYRRGAFYEEARELPATYNRLNALKLALMIGESRLTDLADELGTLRDSLANRLATDEVAADDAWLWADLADTRLLLGDIAGAELAYRSFIDRARTDSPDVTLSVLRDLLDQLEKNGDPAAPALRQSAAHIERVLA